MMSAKRQTHREPRRSSAPQTPRELLKSPALICGLGNPGEKYAHTRHNIGFAVIDALARRYDVRYWKSEAGCQTALITVTGSSGLTGTSAQSFSSRNAGGQSSNGQNTGSQNTSNQGSNRRSNGQKREVLLAKPQDFMNTSGGPLSKLARARRISPADILVVHDEVDLEEGRTRVRAGGGLNAHNGLRSIADKLGTRDFMRLQCGIGRPPGRMKVADYVLRELKGATLEEFLVTVEVAADEVEKLLKTSTQAAETNGIKIDGVYKC